MNGEFFPNLFYTTHMLFVNTDIVNAETNPLHEFRCIAFFQSQNSALIT